MLPFAGSTNPEAYLDWELVVEQKFNSHVVPEEHRNRLANSEFTVLHFRDGRIFAMIIMRSEIE